MSPGPILAAFSRLRTWERDGQRAPHKPLLVLLALGRWVQGDRGPLRYADIEKPLRDLLIEFGPPRKTYHPEFPFWFLRNDGVWEVVPDQNYPPRKGHTSPSAKQLKEAGAVGQFTQPVKEGLSTDPSLVLAIARALLDAHFPPSVHEDILAAVGIDPDAPTPVRAARDRAFREAVLVAYRFACAVCRVGVRLGHSPVGVEAAHIRWHASGGPDEVTNGLCLCSLHHKLLDRGALTLSPDAERVWVSEQANGKNVERALGRFHGRKVAKPNRPDDAPATANVAWHHREVFQGRPRG
jgi:putative restriction endonuclease